MGFKRTVSDVCVYTHIINDFDVTIAVYVDDLIIACTDLDTIKTGTLQSKGHGQNGLVLRYAAHFLSLFEYIIVERQRRPGYKK